MPQQVGNNTRFFSKDEEEGFRVTEEGYVGGGGYPYVTLRRNENPSKSDIKDLIEHERLKSFEGFL